MNLAEALDLHAVARPDHPAIIAGERVIDHADLAGRVRSLTGRLAGAGVEAGDRVGVCLKDTPEHLVAIYALARLGAIVLPMDWRWTTSEKTAVAVHFAARLVLVEPGEPPIGAAALSTLDALPAPPPGWRDGPPAPGEDLWLLLSLSSGTTGLPKGPCITHGQMLRRFWTHWIDMGLNATDRFVSATPLYFGGGRAFSMSVLFCGGTVVLFPPPFDAAMLTDELHRAAATSCFMVPTQLRRVLDASEDGKAIVRRLRLLISSGAPLDPAERSAIAATLNDNFVEYYASTEGGGVSLSTPRTRIANPNSVGRAVFGVQVQCVSDDHEPLPTGVVGQLRYRGPGVASEYFAQPAGEDSPFRDGWFYPGDLAAIDAGGHVELRGRRKDVIIRGGVNIYPAEIERVLREHPDVADAAVVGAASALLGETVAAFVVSRGEPDADSLAAWCAQRLAPYKAPQSLTFLDELPRNSAGKVLKAALRPPQI